MQNNLYSICKKTYSCLSYTISNKPFTRGNYVSFIRIAELMIIAGKLLDHIYGQMIKKIN